MSELETAPGANPWVAHGMVLALAVLGLACGEPAQDGTRDLRARAEPHLRAFETFDAWARRSLDADLALRNVRALEEMVFAPIRREPRVVAAWVEREGADARRLRLRTESPLTFQWVELRGVPMLDHLEAAEAELPDARASGSPPVRVLVLSRKSESARGGGDVRVTIAFAAQTD